MFERIKTHIEMTLTFVCGLLIVAGFLLNSLSLPLAGTSAYILAVLTGGYFSAKEGFGELFFERHLSVDILMILAAIGACLIGDWMEGALLIFIFSLAESLETQAMNKSQNAISALMSLTPDTAHRYQGTHLEDVLTADLKVGDTLQVKKGETVPIDGRLISSFAQVNEASVTGESLPVDKTSGADLIGGTLNTGNPFDMEVTVENDKTLFAKIIRMVQEAQERPSKTASFIESIEDIYVKAVLVAVPLFILFMHLGVGLNWHDAFYRGMVLLTVASPCALVASATPATLSAISRATRNNILFKGGKALDMTSQVKAIVFDKTGTLTKGQPSVVASYYWSQEKNLIQSLVKTAESQSSHPLAQALIKHLGHVPLIRLDALEDITGSGFQVLYQGKTYKMGKAAFALKAKETLDPEALQQLEDLQSQGATLIYVSDQNQTLAAFALEDTLKAESRQAISALKALGLKTIMLTGDQEASAQAIGQALGLDQIKANCLPADKAAVILDLQKEHGLVSMVGDGINDAPALASADVSFAMGSGTDIAMESADVVLMSDDLNQIPFSIGLSRALKTKVKQNIVFSLAVIVLLILTNALQWISLPLGVVGHEGSTILVILNGLTLLAYKDHSLKQAK